MEPPYRFEDRADYLPYHKLPSPLGMTVNEEEEGKELFDGFVHADEMPPYRSEEHSSSIPSPSNAPPVPSPSRTGFYVFGDSRPPAYASPPRDYPLRADQNGADHSAYEADYHQHGGAAVHHYYSTSHSHVPQSIDPTRLYSRPPRVELAQREPVVSRPRQPPMALLRPLTYALPREYHNSTCPRYRPHPQYPSQQQSEVPETPVSDESTPGGPSVRRTKTSYDQKTTYMLNTLFFETYGHGFKPSKRQRSRIQRKIGITSRRLTYWFSNHKRRAKQELKAYKRLLQEGKIYNYDSYINYRNNNDVPELREKNTRGDTVDDLSSDEEKSAVENTTMVHTE